MEPNFNFEIKFPFCKSYSLYTIRNEICFPNCTCICTRVPLDTEPWNNCFIVDPLHFFSCRRCLALLLSLITVYFGSKCIAIKKPDLHLEHVAAVCCTCKQTSDPVRICEHSNCLPYKLFGGLFCKKAWQLWTQEGRGSLPVQHLLKSQQLTTCCPCHAIVTLTLP